MIRTILVGVDDSPAAFAAATVAVDLAARMDARLVAVSVVDGVLRDARIATEHDPGRLADRARRPAGRAAEAAQHHVHVLAERAQVSMDARIVHGHVADELLAVAQTEDADLIVVGRVDRPGVRLAHVGRTAEQVLEFSPVPVLVVPVPRP